MTDNYLTFSIHLLTYNRPDLVFARIDELATFVGGREDVSVTVLDNGSDAATVLALADAQLTHAERLDIKVLRLDSNIGFGPGFNHLVSQTEGDVVVLISDDVAIHGDFIPALMKAFETRSVILCQQVIGWAAGWNVFGGLPPIPYPAGHFLAMYRDLWEKLEGFDPLFVPNDYEDVDLGMKALQAGFPLKEIELPIVHVGGGICHTTDRYANTLRQRAAFAKKWALSNIPEAP